MFINYLFNIEAIEEAEWKSSTVLYKKPVGVSLALERVIKWLNLVSTSLQRTYPQQKNQHSYIPESFSKCYLGINTHNPNEWGYYELEGGHLRVVRMASPAAPARLHAEGDNVQL